MLIPQTFFTNLDRLRDFTYSRRLPPAHTGNNFLHECPSHTYSTTNSLVPLKLTVIRLMRLYQLNRRMIECIIQKKTHMSR